MFRGKGDGWFLSSRNCLDTVTASDTQATANGIKKAENVPGYPESDIQPITLDMAGKVLRVDFHGIWEDGENLVKWRTCCEFL